jgi:hypothetical protein
MGHVSRRSDGGARWRQTAGSGTGDTATPAGAAAVAGLARVAVWQKRRAGVACAAALGPRPRHARGRREWTDGQDLCGVGGRDGRNRMRGSCLHVIHGWRQWLINQVVRRLALVALGRRQAASLVNGIWS